jgi:phosphoglycolate phosphatase
VRFLVFDLDGTISNPALGIHRSINHALAAFGHPGIGEQEVSQHIGPPLDVAFRRIVPGASDEMVRHMVVAFRERYGEVGYAENAVYDGVPEALEHLASRGVPMGVCTSKRIDFAERILTLFRLRTYFAFVSGGDVGVGKQEQLRALVERGVLESEATMIGDRAVDVIAARASGLGTVGVLWGHGSRVELCDVSPDRLLELPVELKDLASLPRAGGRA